MLKITINNEKLKYCPHCGENCCKYNDEILLIKKVSTIIINKNNNEIIAKCSKCKKDIKIS